MNNLSSLVKTRPQIEKALQDAVIFYMNNRNNVTCHSDQAEFQIAVDALIEVLAAIQLDSAAAEVIKALVIATHEGDAERALTFAETLKTLGGWK